MPFQTIHAPRQELVAALTGRTELGVCQELQVARGMGDEDDCYRIVELRQFNIQDQQNAEIFDRWQPWAADEVVALWFMADDDR